MKCIKIFTIFSLCIILLLSFVLPVTLTGNGELGPVITTADANSQGVIIHLNATTNGIITRVVLGSADASSGESWVRIIQNGVVLTTEHQGSWAYDSNPMVKIAPENYSAAIQSNVDSGNFQIMINSSTGDGSIGTDAGQAYDGTYFGYYSQPISARTHPEGQFEGYPWIVFNQTEGSVVGNTTTLVNPTNNSISISSRVNMRYFLNITNYNYNWTNFTQYVWFPNGTSINITTRAITNVNNASNVSIPFLTIGNYLQNFYSCYTNSSGYPFCNWYQKAGDGGNLSFAVGASISSHTYNATTYETAKERFKLVVDVPTGAEISQAKLQYNGTNYTISNISTSGNQVTFFRDINIPLNIDPLGNQTNSFSYIFTYGGDQVQTLSGYTQNSSFVNLHECNATSLYSIEALNMTLFDETTQIVVNISSTLKNNFQGFFEYWLGGGSVVKNYSYSNLNNATQASYRFCVFPETKTFRTDLNSLYDASGYSERQYYLSNASLTNTSSQIPLFLLNDSAAVKFTITTKQGADFLSDAYVTISKFFIGDGVYKTISIRKTDDNGQFVEYLDLDRDYRFSIVKDGQLLAVLDKQATCATAPCEFTLQVDEGQGSVWSSLSGTWSSDTLSNLSYDPSTNIITYNFVDTTGLANYFRLEVRKDFLNDTIGTICDTKVYASSGSATCNVTGIVGDIIARGYISRSPEKLDALLQVALGELAQNLGLLGVFAAFMIILTITFAGAAISGGNPSVILFMFGMAILGTKLMTLLPFSWGIVAVIELVVIVLVSYTKS